jgi:hypothetical protein
VSHKVLCLFANIQNRLWQLLTTFSKHDFLRHKMWLKYTKIDYKNEIIRVFEKLIFSESTCSGVSKIRNQFFGQLVPQCDVTAKDLNFMGHPI